MESELRNQTLKKLRDYCKSQNIKEYSNKNKNDLINYILDEIEKNKFINEFNFDSSLFSKTKPIIDFNLQTMKQLREYCKSHNIKGYWKFNKKSDIINLITNEEERKKNRKRLINQAINKSKNQTTKKSINEFNFHSSLFSKTKAPREKQIKCEECNKYYKKSYEKNHISSHKKVLNKDEEIEEVETAYDSRLKTYLIKHKKDFVNPIDFLDDERNRVIDKISEILKTMDLKVNLILSLTFGQVGDKGIIDEIKQFSFKTQNEIILQSTDLNKFYDNVIMKMMKEMDDFHAKGSGWTLMSIDNLELRINKYNPLRGSSYIDLPEKIKRKEAIINVKNKDNKCFMWSVLSAIYPVDKNPQRVTKYESVKDKLNFEGINFPVSFTDISKFEKLNNISINVYGYEESVHPLRITKNKLDKHVNLFYIKDNENDHYCWIKDLSRLIKAQVINKKVKIYPCERCLTYYYSSEKLEEHEIDCKNKAAVKIEMPRKNEYLYFKNYNRSLRVPFVIYADFECFTKKIDTCQPDPTQSYTMKYQKHEPNSFCYYVKYENDEYKEPVVYRGSDCVDKFLEMIREEIKDIQKIYDVVKPLNMSDEDEKHFQKTDICHICDKVIEGKKVRDHDHLTGKYRGPAHETCNLNYKNPSFVPVFIHNLSGYDAHLFVKAMGKFEEDIDVIPNTEERYISFNQKVGELKIRFIDSFKFMASSIDALSSNLRKLPEELKEKIKNYSPKIKKLEEYKFLKSMFRETSKYYNDEKLDLITRKGVYPYDYIDSEERFEETELPPIKEFYNKLNDYNITENDYKHAQNVWKKFEIKNLGQYSDLYVKSDVLILADIFENFRDVCLKTYKLDPAWYFTAPGLSWDAMLKTTEIELELLNDYDMILMLEKGIRGGVSQCCNRYAKANNKYMKKFDKNQPSSYLMYLDANNLYGWAMSQYLPYGGFKWVNPNEIEDLEDDSEKGYILEVDLEYPKELHDDHSDLPLAPENRIPDNSKQSKLLTTLYDKERYVIHYRNLKQCLDMGLKLKKVHRILEFKQSAWLKKYVDLNTNMRTQATNDFEKDFYKLMNNSVFGKTMENIRKRINVKLCNDYNKVEKLVAKPNFKGRTIFDENLTAVHMNKTKVYFNKPIYVGMSILDLSKHLMYDFHYKIMKPKYGNDIKLMYMDTDSLTYLIKTEDFYEDMKDMIELFDTSDYPVDNRYNMPRINKKVLGKMKDENNGLIMEEFIGLRSKMYAHKNEKVICKKSKGIKKCVVNKKISFEDYKDCLFNKRDHYRIMNQFRSYKHEIYSIEVNKKALSPDDDKRFILEDGINTRALGHYKNV